MSNPPCWSCLRTDVKKLPRRGKQYHAHKCPHGVRCLAGTPEGAQGWNGPPLGGKHYCPECVRAKKVWEAARADARRREQIASLPETSVLRGLLQEREDAQW